MICGMHATGHRDCHEFGPVYVETVNQHSSSRAAGVWPVSPLVFQGDDGFPSIWIPCLVSVLRGWVVACTWSGCQAGEPSRACKADSSPGD